MHCVDLTLYPFVTCEQPHFFVVGSTQVRNYLNVSRHASWMVHAVQLEH